MKYYIVDAFTDALFKGNPAGVCVLDRELDDQTMQDIAAENNLSETAFVLKKDGQYGLRWFTPKIEVDLCGHATLASAYVVTNFVDPGLTTIGFDTKSGILTVDRDGDLYTLDFPSRKPEKIDVTPLMEEAIGVPISEAHLFTKYLLLLLDDAQKIERVAPDFEKVKQITKHGAIVTAKSDGAPVDFVSRYFAPAGGVNEDPVTGASHTLLIPFWSERLGKERMVARQLSKRGGTLYVQLAGDRVKIGGHAALYLKGELML